MTDILKKNLKSMLESVDMEHTEKTLLRKLENIKDDIDFSDTASFHCIEYATDNIYEIMREKNFNSEEEDELMNHVQLLADGYRDLFFEMGFLLGAGKLVNIE